MIDPSLRRVDPVPLAYLWPIKINTSLSDPEDWEPELQAIRNAGPQDIVHMFYNSPGGSLSVMKEFATAMDQCPAHIISEACGDLASAVTMLFLKGDEFIVGDDSSFMLHTSTVGTLDKANNFMEFAKFYERSNENLIRKYYKDFLTEEEIGVLLRGGDYWFDAEELKERLRNFVDKREEAAKRAMEEAQEEPMQGDGLEENDCCGACQGACSESSNDQRGVTEIVSFAGQVEASLFREGDYICCSFQYSDGGGGVYTIVTEREGLRGNFGLSSGTRTDLISLLDMLAIIYSTKANTQTLCEVLYKHLREKVEEEYGK